MDPTIRELLRHSIVSARAACRNVSDALRRSPATGVSPSVRNQRRGWSALLRHAADSGNVVEALGDDDFRFRTDLADALFGGRWSHRVGERTTAGHTVCLTEEGWVSNPLWRALGALRGTHATLDSYLTAFAARFGTTYTPEHLD